MPQSIVQHRTVFKELGYMTIPLNPESPDRIFIYGIYSNTCTLKTEKFFFKHSRGDIELTHSTILTILYASIRGIDSRSELCQLCSIINKSFNTK